MRCKEYPMHIREAVVAGRFYQGNPAVLQKEVQDYLAAGKSAAQGRAPEPALMAMLPHAGHIYCGEVIAQTLARVSLPPTLILLGPNHTGRGQRLAVWPDGHWLTPLGPVPVDADLAAELLASQAGFMADTAAHSHEHSLEVLLPFLQMALPTVSIVPVAVGSGDFEALQRAGKALAAILERRKAQGQPVSLIVSSDMNHFASHERTLELDELALQALQRMDARALAQTVAREKISMCGVAPACMAICACNCLGIQEALLIAHTTSGPVSGDFDRVVGYAGAYVSDNACQKT